ncbi:oxaloacetate decarboxylase [Phenylobacterium sp.]|jgi:2-methylisocitrate lyase-like PEP mutase family enzyme|uniref:oxaloacetate decarboxylase n=1 Tax=Phenylobacterium sp. TaxID=1871053 RepID=UPI0037C7CB46
MSRAFLQRLQAGPAVLAPGAYDALSALLIEQAGFEAVYISGASVAYTQLGRPDIGLVSFDHLADVVARIRERVALPIIVDADTGFGNALNVQRTVRVLERFGATAIQIEDQDFPKRCGHLAGKKLIPAEEMVGKIRAACDARNEASIIARTDAIAVEGFEAALERASAYVEAGADIVFVEAPRSVEEMRRVVEVLGVRAPLVANMVEGGVTPILSLNELDDLGFRLAISPGAMVRAIIPQMESFLASLIAHGATKPFADRMTDLAGVNQRIGLDEMVALGAAYDPKSRRAAE